MIRLVTRVVKACSYNLVCHYYYLALLLGGRIMRCTHSVLLSVRPYVPDGFVTWERKTLESSKFSYRYT